ncbi:hypothetical protein HJC23_007575 [Cyclotella cryptica]|uniref:Uncharacterized protein n=1 Tax=Cyclotella cryptica TaxID=29204 RepID=A0ABD3QRJ6_9STRA
MAIIFSIQTHLSTDFVILSEPLQIGVFFKNVSSIGLSSWKVCGVRQDVIDTILENGVGSLFDLHGGRSRDQLQDDKTNPSANSSVVPSKVSDESQSNFIANLSLSDGGSQVSDESGLDDSLASADFPYRDDDEVLLGLPSEYWSCQIIEFPNNEIDDVKRIIPSMSFIVGTILGVTGFCFLVFLIVLRETRDKCHIKQSQPHYNGNQSNELINDIKQIEPFRPSSATTGYRPISSLFLVSYLFQCATFIVFDSDICKRHVCIASTGAYSLVAACVLWVVSGVLVFLMLRKVCKNEILLREQKRKRRKVVEQITTQCTNSCDFVATTFTIAQRHMESPEEQIQTNSSTGSSNATVDSNRGDTIDSLFSSRTEA